jgi:hypothetical protein
VHGFLARPTAAGRETKDKTNPNPRAEKLVKFIRNSLDLSDETPISQEIASRCCFVSIDTRNNLSSYCSSFVDEQTEEESNRS